MYHLSHLLRGFDVRVRATRIDVRVRATGIDVRVRARINVRVSVSGSGSC